MYFNQLSEIDKNEGLPRFFTIHWDRKIIVNSEIVNSQKSYKFGSKIGKYKSKTRGDSKYKQKFSKFNQIRIIC